MCKGLYRLATSREINVNSLCSPICNSSPIVPPRTHLANEQTERSHVVCSDTFRFTCSSLTFFLCENKPNHGKKLKFINWYGPNYGCENALDFMTTRPFSGSFSYLLCRSSQAVLGWMGSVSAQPFSDLFRDVQVQALAGLLKDFQRAVLKPLLCYLGYVLVVLHPVQSLGEGKHQRSIRNWNKAHR